MTFAKLDLSNEVVKSSGDFNNHISGTSVDLNINENEDYDFYSFDEINQNIDAFDLGTFKINKIVFFEDTEAFFYIGAPCADLLDDNDDGIEYTYTTIEDPETDAWWAIYDESDNDLDWSDIGDYWQSETIRYDADDEYMSYNIGYFDLTELYDSHEGDFVTWQDLNLTGGYKVTSKS